MIKKKLVELSSVEATAYWWVLVIQRKVREIVVHGSSEPTHDQFLEIFYNYTDLEWRMLYLKLIEYIAYDVATYLPKGQGTYSYVDAFHQDTDQCGHVQLSRELSAIVHSTVPNIRLAGFQEKDSVIYTTRTRTSVWYKSCGINYLPTDYEASYILTGDEEERMFYNLLLCTMDALKHKDESFQSIPILRERFCSEYLHSSASQKEIEDVTMMFNRLFNQISSRGLLVGKYFRDTYFTTFCDIDLVGLDSYRENAEHYADIILEKESKKDGTFLCKKME